MKPTPRKPKLMQPPRIARQLVRVHHEDKSYFCDFRLEELRDTQNPHEVIRFVDLKDEDLKKTLRGVRFTSWAQYYMKGLDD